MKRIPFVIALMTLIFGCGKSAPPLTFLSKTYHLGSYNQKQNPTWEYVTGTETVDNWTTLMTLIDRPDAKAAPDLDRLAEGIMQTYKSHSGRILMARTMREKSGKPYNYMVAAFEDPAKQRFELNFVKFGMGPANAYILIHGARVGGSPDYRNQGKDFLNQHSDEIGKALESAVLPDVKALPRKEF